MKLPHELHDKLCDFLKTLPIKDSSAQQAFLYSAGLDEELENQIRVGGPPLEFIELLIPRLMNYGKIEDGQYALLAALRAAKNYVGSNKKKVCNILVHEIQQWLLEHEATDAVKRAELLTTIVGKFITKDYPAEKRVTIRMRATFTSMSNIKRGLKFTQEQLEWLVKERCAVQKLLKLDEVQLKCICWPNLQFLGYYTA
jgi:hypothetical protein